MPDPTQPPDDRDAKVRTDPTHPSPRPVRRGDVPDDDRPPTTGDGYIPDRIRPARRDEPERDGEARAPVPTDRADRRPAG